MNASNEDILVINALPDPDSDSTQEWRGIMDRIKWTKVPADNLALNTREFVENITKVFNVFDETLDSYELDSVEVSVALTTAGRLTLINIGGEVSSTGTFKFTFKKPQEEKSKS